MQNTTFIIYFLITVRVMALLMTSPVFSVKQIPSFVKVAFSLVLGILIAPTINTQHITVAADMFSLLLMCFKEIIIGVSIGFIATLFFNAIKMAAQMMDFSVGFSMSQYYDPTISAIATPLERFANWFALVLFVTFNFHLYLISAIVKSFEVLNVGSFAFNTNLFNWMISVFSRCFLISIQLAAPVIIVLFLTDFTLGLIARTVPQFNVFMLSMPVKMLIGLAALLALLPSLSHMYLSVFQEMLDHLLKYFNFFPFIMLMASDDKTEEPTEKKLSDAKKKGQIPKSVDLNSSMVLLGITIIFIVFGEMYFTYGTLSIQEGLKFITKDQISINSVSKPFIFMLKNILIGAAPIALTALVLGVVANIIQTGFMISGEGLKPKLDKLNPIQGFKRLFSKRALVELLKTNLKIILIAYITFTYVKSQYDSILKTIDLPPGSIYFFVKNITDSQLVRLLLVVMIIGVADYIFQKRQFKKDMRMTKQEIKEEYKQMEGDPQIKSRIKQKQREMATRRMMSEVPKSTVVVTNPTHFAVALKYDTNISPAPYVVAKGADLVAMKIKEIAKDSNIPIIENKPLARALFAQVEINQEVPLELYQAVAEIIAYVYSMKKM